MHFRKKSPITDKVCEGEVVKHLNNNNLECKIVGTDLFEEFQVASITSFGQLTKKTEQHT